MCGVVSIVYLGDNESLGRESASLVRKLEYRGYDSTGVAVIAADGAITLRKKVGAPSRVVLDLDIERLSGQKSIGQVRWATYGSVTDTNAQPHEVRCRIHLVGAHNGNISNTDSLKEFLLARGHNVVSDNDGEMLTHVVENCLADEAPSLEGLSPEARVAATIRAIRKANALVIGSYAACVAIPGIDGVFAMKAGSSLYAGKGSDDAGEFVVVSSDLTSVLSKTRFLVPLSEGEGLHFTHDRYVVFSLSGEDLSVPPLRRSRLDIAEVSLQPKYHFFMEQEIASSGENLARIQRYYFSLDWEARSFEVFERHESDCKAILFDLLRLYDVFDRADLGRRFRAITADTRFRAIASEVESLHAGGLAAATSGFSSDESQLFHELSGLGGGADERSRLLALDLMVVWKKKRQLLRYKKEAIALLRGPGAVHLVGSGTSYHAALAGAVFFADGGGRPVLPSNPGLFRSLVLPGLAKGDVVVAVSQSGETKDLVDIINDVRTRHGNDVHIISIVNNENSTIPQEKSDFFLPILCGPEIAVAATKSFTNQLALFFLLAAGRNAEDDVVERKLDRIRHALDATVRLVEDDIAATALRLFLAPSMHILGTSTIGLAREGALKIREVVLNHTEGYDSAEFKHGPNTILGRNTVFSLRDLEKLLADFAGLSRELLAEAAGSPERAARVSRLFDRIADFGFRNPVAADEIEARDDDRFKEACGLENYFSNYPLVFLCPPDERDIRITVTQIHTHKIRGADIILVAEDDDDLRRAVEGRPAESRDWWSKFIRVPRSGDPAVFTFQAAVVLQLLAFRMSVAKMKYLNKARVENHGVHPDVPKNVSKSITVD